MKKKRAGKVPVVRKPVGVDAVKQVSGGTDPVPIDKPVPWQQHKN